MSTVHTIVAFVVALGILIVVHEYGHYLAARLFGVKVLRFSIGFGRALVSRRLGRDRTEWVVSAIPLGGYVKMLDEREGPVEPGERDRAFNRQTVAKRFAIVCAGPVFNFIFAVAVYAGLFMYGLPAARPVVAQPASGTPAQLAGFRAGDTVRAIDGKPIATWQDLRWQVVESALEHRSLSVERVGEDGASSVIRLDLSGYDESDEDVMERVGLRLYRPVLAPVLGKLIAGSPAERAGLRPGDRIVAIDGNPIASWEQLVKVVRAHPETPIQVTLERSDARMTLAVTPEAARANGERIGHIGAAPFVPPEYGAHMLTRVRYGPIASLAKGAAKTFDIASFSLRMLGRMLVGQLSWRHLSGPVTIADFAGQSAQLGWIPYLTFLALISISLGVLNLLPIPLLDGGHLMYYVAEVIKGGPLSDRTVEFGQRVGLALLLILMGFALYNDLNRLFSS